jgi:AraC-like DNA-binding protein
VTARSKVVQDAAPVQANHFPTAMGGMSRLAYAKLASAGVPAEPLLNRAGITLDQIRNPTLRIKAEDQIKFLNLASRALKDEFLGLDLAQHVELRQLGLIYYIASSSENLKDAFERAARYTALANEGVVQEFITGEHHGMSIRYEGVSRHLDRHQIEFWMAAIVRVCRKLSGRRIVPRSVRFVHVRKGSYARFHGLFGDDVKFGARSDEVTFTPNLEQIPIIGADPFLNQLLIEYCDEALANRPGRISSFQSSVENAIVPLLPHGQAGVSEIASRLGVSTRTLTRRLSFEGLSFSKLLEDLKIHLAKRYLADKELSISQVAWLLGYQESGAFSRAFKRWTGKSPREARSV